MADPNLPSFENPPVTEVAIGIEFAPIMWWGLQHFGLLWQEIREQYPKCVGHPAIPPSVENFESPAPPPLDAIGISFGNDPSDARCWYSNDSEAELVQVQRNRFVRNWRRTLTNEAYPRYSPHLRPEFQKSLINFFDFVARQGEDIPFTQQVEVTYVNDFEEGREWNGLPDLRGVITLWSGNTSTGFLPSPYGMRVATSYQMPDERGRLHVTAQRALRAQDGKQVIQMRLVARRRPENSDMAGIMKAVDECREWIVRGFDDLTTPKMHALWRKQI